ncbi:MAG TPA: STAS domain-containing protein [Burkholderiales bacterium]|nr:STAS domain-containing protein [Betaproteobacteria bacterium]HQR52362.1 STAS domain-containing protein [Burkholderiales bacterium]
MDVHVQQSADGIDRVVLAGRFDSMAAGDVDKRLGELATAPAARILVDLSQVSFLASIGIRTLLSAARTLRKHGGKMVLLSPQAPVEEVLRITAIESILPVFGDFEVATAALQAGAASG